MSENTMTRRYRQKPIKVEAEQFFSSKPLPFHDRGPYVGFENGLSYVKAANGMRTYLREGDWVVLEPDGDYRAYPVRPDIFESRYEPVDAARPADAHRADLVDLIDRTQCAAEALRIVDFNEREQKFFCRACRYHDPLGPDGNKLHDDNCPWVEYVGAFKQLVDALTPAAPIPSAEALAQIADRLQAVYDSFVFESLNGVVCSIPDEGIDTRPHRTWCARCQGRYRELQQIAIDLRSISAQPAPTTRMFPIQDGPDIPWDLIAPFEKQAKHNHGGQTLERLAQRGGLGVYEALAVLHAKQWFEMWPNDKYPEREDAILQLQALIREREAVRLR